MDVEQASMPITVKFRVDGMTCSTCNSAVESLLASIPGVCHASVSLTLQEAKVEFDPNLTDETVLLQAIEDAGFEARSLGRGDTSTVILEVSGMTCASCTGLVETILKAIDGVIDANANAVAGRADVQYNSECVGPRSFIAALSDAGYEARVAPHDGTTNDGALLRQKEKMFWRRKFLLALAFSFPLFVINMILMYIKPVQRGLDHQSSGFTIGNIVSFALATPVQFWVGWTFHKGAWKAMRRGRPNMDVLVSLGTNASYLYSIISIVWQRTHAEFSGHNFFETSALLITFICLGKYMEAAAKGKTSQAIRELLRLAPATAVLCTLNNTGTGTDSSTATAGDGKTNNNINNNSDIPNMSHRIVAEEEVPTELLQRGDVVKIVPGSKVPVDGMVIDGRSHVDESMITGEPVPPSKGMGDEVVGGTVNCGGGVLWVRAVRVGTHTTLSQIVKLVENAQMSKAPIQALADRLSAVFVPIIVLAAVVTWAGWYAAGVTGAFPEDWIPVGSNPFLFALLFAIAVVVIACPCALGLATPTAVMVGTGVAATNGILIKSAEAIEKAHRLKHVVFDKTGTLTEGEPSVVDHRLIPVQQSNTTGNASTNTSTPIALPLDTVLLAVAAAESGNEHPLGKALMRYAAGTLGHGGSSTPTKKVGDNSDGDANGLNHCEDDSDCSSFEGLQRLSSSNTSQTIELVNGNHFQRAPTTFTDTATTSANTTATVSSSNVQWLPLVKDIEMIPGNGVRCLVMLPASKATAVVRLKNQHPNKSTTHAGNNDTHVEVRIAVGNRALMVQEGCAVALHGGSNGGGGEYDGSDEEGHGGNVLSFTKEWESRGMTCVLVALDGHVVAAFAIADSVRPEAAGVVAALLQRGLRVHMITGDNWATAKTIASQLGIPSVSAEVLPAGKSTQIMALQAGGAAVAMVGDGVNDSPALAAADVGIAVGRGTDIAIEAADYVLMRSDLEDVITALDLSQTTFNRIRWNYLYAFLYNFIAVPIAAGVLYPPLHFQLPPWVAGACMALSSVSVVGSSLLLRRYKPPKRALRRIELSA